MESLNNKQTYQSQQVVEDYAHNLMILIPEILIFIRYKESILGKKVLDLGCGAGRTTQVLSKLTDEYLGLDYSPEMIDYCKQSFAASNFQVGDVRNLDQFGDNSYDFILFSCNGLDYIGHEDRIIALKEIMRVMKSGSLFVFSSHNSLSIDTSPEPQLRRCLNPIRFFKHYQIYKKQLVNRQQNKIKEYSTEDYRLVNDSAHDFSMITYYVNPLFQVKQLRDLGFELLEMYDDAGSLLTEKSNSNHSSAVYYIVKKQ